MRGIAEVRQTWPRKPVELAGKSERIDGLRGHGTRLLLGILGEGRGCCGGETDERFVGDVWHCLILETGQMAEKMAFAQGVLEGYWRGLAGGLGIL